MSLRVRDLLDRGVMPGAQPAAPEGLDREVRWVHIWPEVLPWPHGGELLLTTGYSWPPEPAEQRRIVRDLDGAGVAALLFQARAPFFPKIPEAIVAEATALGLAILESSGDVAFVDLIETVNREIIRSQSETIERSERIHRTLTEAALEAQAVGDIADRLGQLVGKDVVVLDRRLHLLTNEPAHWAGIRAGIEEAIRVLPTRGAHPAHRFTLDADGRAISGVVLPVRAGRDLAGYLVMLAGDGEISDLDVRACEHGAVVVGLHVLRQQATADAEARVRNSFVEAVLQGRLAAESGLRERAQLLGFDPTGEYCVAVALPVDRDGTARPRALVSSEDFQARSRLGQAVQAALEGLGLPTFIAYMLNEVICLVPWDGRVAQMRTRMAELLRRVHDAEPALSIALLVGRPGRGDADIATTLREAEAALTSVHGSGVWWYEDLLVLRIVASAADRDAVRTLREVTVKALRTRSEALYETARTLVHVGFQQRLAARTLNVHWNTLRHRLTRIEEVLGAPLSDPDLRLKLQLAFEAEKTG
ncbi:MAG: PucR family transcriptional regulator ligand-binding domain-containing protein [bacterium]|nr:PucR family transcriptional regulator ligand-binding domain-containing protein [bacterium]